MLGLVLMCHDPLATYVNKKGQSTGIDLTDFKLGQFGPDINVIWGCDGLDCATLELSRIRLE